jgi:hypothetical protein
MIRPNVDRPAAKEFQMRLLRLVLLFSAALSGGASAEDEWISFKDPKGEFTVELPAKPSIRNTTANADDGTAYPVIEYTFELSQVALSVGVGEFPADERDPAGVIDACISGIKSHADTIEYDQPSVLDGHAGHEIIISNRNGVRFDDRVYYVDGRLYQVSTVTSKSTPGAQKVEGEIFLGSFHFTAK